MGERKNMVEKRGGLPAWRTLPLAERAWGPGPGPWGKRQGGPRKPDLSCKASGLTTDPRAAQHCWASGAP